MRHGVDRTLIQDLLMVSKIYPIGTLKDAVIVPQSLAIVGFKSCILYGLIRPESQAKQPIPASFPKHSISEACWGRTDAYLASRRSCQHEPFGVVTVQLSDAISFM
ncbi:unnamed protein product [Protopolystoma xenopodis]|uniref:Uncharacterized protein n=1 Tax=Protopolystoma xenopodis TaxID=117903 RepID=A0A3S5CN27_9PLAT|nr:unnamed protein product [Protopolystoma xenopodis]